MTCSPKTPPYSYSRTFRTPPFLSPDPRYDYSSQPSTSREQTPSPTAKRQSFGRDFAPVSKEEQNELTKVFLDLFPGAEHLLATPTGTSFNEHFHPGPSDFDEQEPKLCYELSDFGIEDFLLADPSPSSSPDADLSLSSLSDDVSPPLLPLHFSGSSDLHQLSSSLEVVSEPSQAFRPRQSAKRSLAQFLVQTQVADPEATFAASSTQSESCSLTDEIRSMAMVSSSRALKQLGTKNILLRYYGLYLLFNQKLPKTKPSAISPEVWENLQSKKHRLITSIAIGDYGVTVKLSAHFNRAIYYHLVEANKPRSESELTSFYDDFSAIFAITSEIENDTMHRTITLPKKMMDLLSRTTTKNQTSELIASFFYKLIVNTCVEAPAVCLKKQGSIYLHHHLQRMKIDQMIKTVIVNTIEEMSADA